MQPITLEPISIVAIVIIIVTLAYSYLNYRLEDKKEILLREHKSNIFEPEENQHVVALITAVVALLMEQKPFKIKNIVAGKREEISAWKAFGRWEIMRRRSHRQR